MALVASAGKSIQRIKTAGMDAFSLSAAHTDCLSSLALAPDGLTQAQLAGALRMDRAQVSRVLRDLRAHAYVRTDGDPGYRRRYRLTDAGRRIAEEIARVSAQVSAYVRRGIPPEELESFYRTFSLLAKRLGDAAGLCAPPEAGPGRDA